MKPTFIVLGLVAAFGCGLRAQSAPAAGPVDVKVCDVVKNPAKFDGQMVRIKGTVVAGFDEFIIKDSTDPNCGFQENAIWLSYPQGSKAKSGPLAIVTVQPARNFAGSWKAPARTPVVLDKSKDFKQFDSLLAQSHQKGADLCLGCARYEVTATLVGRLDGVADAILKRDVSGKIVGFGGFGNMNAYPARLVLQSVSDVSPKEIDYSKTDAAAKGDAAQAPAMASDLSAAVTALQKMAGAMAASQLKDLAVKAAAVYGKQNGVNIGFGRVAELSSTDGAQGTSDSPDGVLFNCVFNEDHLQGAALASAIVHLGTHITELRDPAKDSEGAPAYVLESDAWVVTTAMAAASGQKFFTLPGGYQIWNTTWPADSRNDKMDAALKDFLSNGAMLSQ